MVAVASTHYRMAKASMRSTSPRGQRWQVCSLLIVTALATVVDSRQIYTDNQHLEVPQTTRRVLSDEWSHVQMPPQHRLLPAQKAFLAVCTVVKVACGAVRTSKAKPLTAPPQNEHLDVVEWLVHHLAVGVGHFYMCVGDGTQVSTSISRFLYRYDDHSDPPMRDLLEPWIQSNLVTYLTMEYDPSDSASKKIDWQVLSFQHCMDTFSIHHEWLAFIDPDEFIYLPNPQHPRLHDLLLEFDRYSGLVMSWIVFGSSGHVQRPNGVVIAVEGAVVHATTAMGSQAQ